MSFILIVDHRKNNNSVSALVDDNGRILVYETLDEVKRAEQEHVLAKVFPCIIIDLDGQAVAE